MPKIEKNYDIFISFKNSDKRGDAIKDKEVAF